MQLSSLWKNNKCYETFPKEFLNINTLTFMFRDVSSARWFFSSFFLTWHIPQNIPNSFCSQYPIGIILIEIIFNPLVARSNIQFLILSYLTSRYFTLPPWKPSVASYSLGFLSFSSSCFSMFFVTSTFAHLLKFDGP